MNHLPDHEPDARARALADDVRAELALVSELLGHLDDRAADLRARRRRLERELRRAERRLATEVGP